MANSKLLKEVIRKKGTTITALAPKVNLTREGLTKKIDGTNEFKASEIIAITKELKLSFKERENIFFNQQSECYSLNFKEETMEIKNTIPDFSKFSNEELFKCLWNIKVQLPKYTWQDYIENIDKMFLSREVLYKRNIEFEIKVK